MATPNASMRPCDRAPGRCLRTDAVARSARLCAQGKYPDKPVRIDPAVRRGRRRRHHDAAGGREARRKARPAFRGREQCRAPAASPRRARCCRSPADGYTLAVFTNGTAISVGAVQEPAVRSGEGFRAGLGHGLFRPDPRHQCQRPLQDARRLHQGREGQAGPAQYRHHRRRLEPESRRRIVQVGRRHRFRDRAVQDLGRRAGRARAQRRPDGDRILRRLARQPRRQEIHPGRDVGHAARRVSAGRADREGGRRRRIAK